MEAVRHTTSEGAELDLDGLGQALLAGNNAWPEAVMDAPSFPIFFASPPIATTATATTNSCLGQPSVAMASEGATVVVGAPDQLVSGINGSSSTFLLDATTNGGAPATTNTSSIQLSISTMSWEAVETDLDGQGQTLLAGGDNAWLGAAVGPPGSPSFFASTSIFPSYATTITTTTNTCLSQPSITLDLESEGATAAMVDLDLDELLSGDNAWLQVATIASNSPSFFDSSSTFPLLDARASWGTPASTNICLIQPSISTTSFQGPGANLSLLRQQLSGYKTWSEVAAIASSSSGSLFGSLSTFPLGATATIDRWTHDACTDTCLIHPSIPSSQGAAVDSDHLLEQLLSAGYAWTRTIYFGTSSSTSSFPSCSVFQTLTATSSSVLERLMQALTYIGERHRGKDAFVQVWLPAKRGDDQLVVVTRSEQPFMVAMRLDGLKELRDVSTQYHFSAHVKPGSGLPERVYAGNVPEWFPEVLYSCYTMQHEHSLPSGTIGLPVFDKANNSCLGVIELIMMTQELGFISERDIICSALQAVNLTTTTTQLSRISRTKFNGASYIDALPEILQVLRAACIIHDLPLAQTWATCAQQGKQCTRHSDENHQYCISTIEAACYVNDPRMQFFHEASSLHNLLPGQGVAGKAFTTNQRCFLPDIGSFK